MVYSGLLVGLFNNAGAQNLKLWYDKPANTLGEAHPGVAVAPVVSGSKDCKTALTIKTIITVNEMICVRLLCGC